MIRKLVLENTGAELRANCQGRRGEKVLKRQEEKSQGRGVISKNKIIMRIQERTGPRWGFSILFSKPDKREETM